MQSKSPACGSVAARARRPWAIDLASPCLKRSMTIESINWSLPHRAHDHYGLYWLSSQRADGPVLDYHFDYNVRHLTHRPASPFRFDYTTAEEE